MSKAITASYQEDTNFVAFDGGKGSDQLRAVTNLTCPRHALVEMPGDNYYPVSRGPGKDGLALRFGAKVLMVS